MRNIVQEKKLLPADRIVVPKSIFGIIKHHAIYLGKDHFGTDLIAENVPGQKVLITSADEFSRKNQSEMEVIRFLGNNMQREQAIRRALKSLNKSYSLINFNCEHFANLVQHGTPFSNQVRFGFGMLLVLTIATIALSD